MFLVGFSHTKVKLHVLLKKLGPGALKVCHTQIHIKRLEGFREDETSLNSFPVIVTLLALYLPEDTQ